MGNKDESMLEMAKTLKNFCAGHEGDCCGCVFQNPDPCIMCAIAPEPNTPLPEEWPLD